MSGKKRKSQSDVPLNWQKIYEEMSNTNDRAAAIVGEAILDQCLLTLLSNYFVDNRKEGGRLLQHPGPLSSFYGKSILAYCVGLITQGQLDDLMAINQIRIHFAHGLQSASFEDQPVKAKMSRIEQYKRFLSLDQVGSPRKKFDAAVSILAYSLSIESGRTAHCQEKKTRSVSELLKEAMSATS